MINLTDKIVDVETLANYLELSPRRVQQMVSELGAPKPQERGEYNFTAFVRWYITHLRNENEKLKMGDETLYKLEQEDKRVITATRKLKLIKDLKQIVHVDLVNDAYSRDMIAFRSEIENFRAYLNTSLGLDEEQKANAAKKIDQILTRLGTELNLEDEPDEIIADNADEIEVPE